MSEPTRTRKQQRDDIKAKTFSITSERPKPRPQVISDTDRRLCEARRKAEVLRDELELAKELDYL